VFVAVQGGRAEYGIVPFENSSHGTVSFTLDGLADRAGVLGDVVVVGEVYLDVHHCLLGFPSPSSREGGAGEVRKEYGNEGDEKEWKGAPRTPLDHIHRVLSHPQAFGQTGVFSNKFLKGKELVEVSSTSKAAEMAKGDETGQTAAVASEMAGEMTGLEVLARWIEDREDNTTRFFVLRSLGSGDGEAREEQERAGGVGEETKGYKSLVSFTVPHRRAGALADVLDCFRRRELNLTSINSLPSLVEPFNYLFFVEFEGSRFNDSEGRVEAVFRDLDEVAERWRWLGSWERQR